MALNPPMTSSGEPCRVEGEYFVMKRSGVEFEFNVANGNKYTGKGYMILTTCRIICLNTDTKSKFKAFDIPLALTSKEDFKQPIFGANYIYGQCQPLMNVLPGKVTFKIWFMEGGCGTFVPAFFSMLDSLRKNKNKGHDTKFISEIASGSYGKVAYVDPNDPSIIYLEQPDIPVSNVSTSSVSQSQSQSQSTGFSNQQQVSSGQVVQGGFSNNQVGFSNQTGFNTQQMGYSSNQVGYSNQVNYNPNQVGYSNQVNYNPNQVGYSNQVNYNPNQVGYSNQLGYTNPTIQTFPSQQDISSQNQGFTNVQGLSNQNQNQNTQFNQIGYNQNSNYNQIGYNQNSNFNQIGYNQNSNFNQIGFNQMGVNNQIGQSQFNQIGVNTFSQPQISTTVSQPTTTTQTNELKIPNYNANITNQTEDINANQYPSFQELNQQQFVDNNSQGDIGVINSNSMNLQSNLSQPLIQNSNSVQNQSSYPENTVQNLGNVNISSGTNTTSNQKYFGFWGPQLKKNY